LTLAPARGIHYGQPTMSVHRQQRATRGFLVLAVLLASLWTGGLVVSAVGDSAHGLGAGHAQPGVQPAALRDRALASRPAEQPDPRGRVLPLLGALAAALAAAHRLLAVWLRPRPTHGHSLARSCPLAARAPPHLQPA
jgi:hypothetical protein